MILSSDYIDVVIHIDDLKAKCAEWYGTSDALVATCAGAEDMSFEDLPDDVQDSILSMYCGALSSVRLKLRVVGERDND